MDDTQQGNDYTPELFQCNLCGERFTATQAEKCIQEKCQSRNIELASTRPPIQTTSFKPGMVVQFKGLKHKEFNFPPMQGTLKGELSGVPAGCVSIKEDEKLRLIFNEDGTLYCHAWLGALLIPVVQAHKSKLKDPENSNADTEREQTLFNLADYIDGLTYSVYFCPNRKQYCSTCEEFDNTEWYCWQDKFEESLLGFKEMLMEAHTVRALKIPAGQENSRKLAGNDGLSSEKSANSRENGKKDVRSMGPENGRKTLTIVEKDSPAWTMPEKGSPEYIALINAPRQPMETDCDKSVPDLSAAEPSGAEYVAVHLADKAVDDTTAREVLRKASLGQLAEFGRKVRAVMDGEEMTEEFKSNVLEAAKGEMLARQAGKKSLSHLKPAQAPKTNDPVKTILECHSLSEVGRMSSLLGQDAQKMRQLWREKHMPGGKSK